MNLQVLPFSKSCFSILKNNSKVSFGEYDGDFNSFNYPRMSKADYDIKKELINEKYDKKRSSWLQSADDLELSSAEVWKQLENIEKMRDSELEDLKSEFI